jgi:hypothetical protein
MSEDGSTSANRLADAAYEGAAFLAPLALVVGLALAGGGFDLPDRHVAGLIAWLSVMALVLLGSVVRGALGRPLYLTGAALGALALFDVASAGWSGSVERSVNEADRVLVYLGFFLFAFLLAQTPARRRRFVEGLAVGLGVVATLALFSRLFPDVITPSESQLQIPIVRARLSYPLGYWNATAAMIGMSIPLLLWLGRRGSLRIMRAAGISLLPVATLAVYFTYSRGGALTAAIALLALLVFSRDRLWYGLSAATTALVTGPLVLAVQARRELADGVQGQVATSQGHDMAWLVLLAMLVSVGIHAGVRWYGRQRGPGSEALLRLSRNRAALRTALLATIAVVAIVGITVGGRSWSKFTQPDFKFPKQSEQRFTDVTGTGRYQMWEVALEQFRDHPLVGDGAGSYEFRWNEKRPIALTVRDAHSLYIESLGELGIIGAGPLLVAVLAPLGLGIAALRRLKGEDRETLAICLAVAVAFAIAAGFDWFWEIAALGAAFFLATGVIVAMLCAQRRGPDSNARDDRGPGRFGLGVAAIVAGWLACAALFGPLVAHRQITASQRAAARGDLAAAQKKASTARSIEPWAASPYLQLGLVAEAAGDYTTALTRLSEAIDREGDNWVLWLLRSRIQEEAGHRREAAADRRRARQLNPLATSLQITQGEPQ